MLRLRSVFPAVVAAALGCATRGPIARTERARTEARALERDYLEALVRRDPLEAAAPGSLRGADRAVVRDDDLAAIAAWREAEDGFLARARAIDGRVLAGTPDGVARALLVEALEGARGARACRFELWQVSPDAWRALAEVQPIGTVASRAHVSATARRIGIQIESLREGVRLGYVATRENVERVLEVLDRLLAAPPASWPRCATATRRRGRSSPRGSSASSCPPWGATATSCATSTSSARAAGRACSRFRTARAAIARRSGST